MLLAGRREAQVVGPGVTGAGAGSNCEPIPDMSLFHNLKLKRRKVDSRGSSDGKSLFIFSKVDQKYFAWIRTEILCHISSFNIYTLTWIRFVIKLVQRSNKMNSLKLITDIFWHRDRLSDIMGERRESVSSVWFLSATAIVFNWLITWVVFLDNFYDSFVVNHKRHK